MRFDLESGTDAGIHLIFDPAAAIDLIRMDPAAKDGGETTEAGERGDVLAYSYGGDGDMHFRIFVDEDPDPEIEGRKTGDVQRGFLRIPSGRLFCAGMEFLRAEAGEAAEPEDYRGSEPASGPVEVPPGIYEVEFFDLDWDGDDAHSAREATKKSVGSVGAKAEGVLGTLTGCAVFGVIPLATIFLFILSFEDRQIFWETVKYVGPAIVGLLVLCFALWQSPLFKKADRARTQAYREFPGACVVLRRCADDADTTGRTSRLFGIGW